MDTIILYSTGCPRCRVLETKLKEKNIDYVFKNDVDEMLEKGIQSVPALEVNGNILHFKEALQWVNKQ
mgnify:CR=1 FL=1